MNVPRQQRHQQRQQRQQQQQQHVSNSLSSFIESEMEQRLAMEWSCLLYSSAARDDDDEYVRVGRNQAIRPLFQSEMETLRGPSCRCSCRDWSKLRLCLDLKCISLDQTTILQSVVSDTAFDGIVVFLIDNNNYNKNKNNNNKNSRISHEPTRTTDWKTYESLPIGVHSNLMITNSILHITSCRVHRNTLISNTHVGPDVIVINCGTISCSEKVKNHLTIRVGPESGGGRNLSLTATATMIDLCQQLQHNNKTANAQRIEKEDVEESNDKYSSSTLNSFMASSVVVHTSNVENVILLPNASILAATFVQNTVLLSYASIRNACTVKRVILQWNASICDHSTISDVLLMEEAHCGPHSIVSSSVLGSDVHVSAGEVHSSILGPNTNAHHQSLVIGVLWPMGRGNVGYGANVGSNHTGRLPDQEAAAGEGTFWGLSSIIKFPVDLTYSPYSIVAAGTNLAPQRIAMPFSLIVMDSSSSSSTTTTTTTTTTELIPGWVLHASPYTISRSETKFATRRNAKRHAFYTGWKILRPEIIEMCRGARNALRASEGNDPSTTKGIGLCTLSKRGHALGIRAYTDCIRRYALKGLLARILSSENCDGHVNISILQSELQQQPCETMTPFSNFIDSVGWHPFPWEVDTSKEWEYQLGLLLEEMPIHSSYNEWLVGCLNDLIHLENDFANRIFKCKKRDDMRGEKTIPGYEAAHVAADKDGVIADARSVAIDTEKAARAVIEQMTKACTSRL